MYVATGWWISPIAKPSISKFDRRAILLDREDDVGGLNFNEADLRTSG